MQALLALAWLSPKDPNLLDNWFGKYAMREHHYQNQIDISLWLLAVMLVFLAWRMIRHAKLVEKTLELVAPKLLPQVTSQIENEKLRTWAERVVTAALVFIALLSSVNYFYATRNTEVYVHRWDAFHTVIGVKYHPELGYFDLYKCSYAIDREGPHHFRTVDEIRDLQTRKFVPRDQHIAGNDCKERFTPERLEEFKHDLNEFGTWSNKQDWNILFKDKGFNGTPFYATVCKPLVNSIEISIAGLKKLAIIDPILMVIAFGVVGWAFGARQAAIMAIFFCVFFPNRFVHMGGSILRFDYVAALMIGFAALKKDKWGLAGAMFAWATMVRVFPAIFAVGLGVKIFSDVALDRKIRPEHWRFVYWFGGLIVLFFLISLVGMHGGFENWVHWWEDMKVHNSKSAAFRVGFKHLFMADGKLTSTNYNVKQELFEQRETYYWVAVMFLLAPLMLAVRRLDTVSFTAMFGVFGFFLLAIATRYYYGVVALLFLIDRKPLHSRYMLIMGAVLFAATAFDFIFFELNNSDPLMYNMLIGIEMTVVLLVLSSCLLFNPALLDLDDDPRLPTHVPARIGATAEQVDSSSMPTLQERVVPPSFNDAITVSDGPPPPVDGKRS